MSAFLDLGFRNGGLGKALSNLMPYAFTLDNVQCGSIEGFLQSIKHEGSEEQELVAGLHGYEAFKIGQLGNGWKETQTLWWCGVAYPRFSKQYHHLLERAYDQCFAENEAFRTALIDSGVMVLTHVMGKHDPTDTTLTEWEYIHQMYRLRALAQLLELGLL
jgi:hypothetical protein